MEYQYKGAFFFFFFFCPPKVRSLIPGWAFGARARTQGCGGRKLFGGHWARKEILVGAGRPADIVVFMVDSTEGASGLDANIAGYAHEERALVILLVKQMGSGLRAARKRAIQHK